MRIKLLILFFLVANMSIAQKIELTGNWIATRCISDDVTFLHVGTDEIKRNIGSKLIIDEINKIIIIKYTTIKDTFNNVNIIIRHENAKSHFNKSMNFTKLMNFNNKNVLIAYTNIDGYLNEFYVLDSKTIAVAVDGFILIFNKINDVDVKNKTVICDKLNFYSYSDVKRIMPYYVVKGDIVKNFFRKPSVSFVEYEKNGKGYYGWVEDKCLK